MHGPGSDLQESHQRESPVVCFPPSVRIPREPGGNAGHSASLNKIPLYVCTTSLFFSFLLRQGVRPQSFEKVESNEIRDIIDRCTRLRKDERFRHIPSIFIGPAN